MKQGIFITGTDTGVGKTYVGCCIAAELRNQGIDVGVMKPVETGCRMRKGLLNPEDANALANAAGINDPIDRINPYRFRTPVAPAVAALLERKRINPNRIMQAFRTLETCHDFIIVEGAGGIMVPLTTRMTFLDLAAEMELPVLIVSRPILGTINHTLLTIEALRRKSLPIAGICINNAKGGRQGIAERTNPDFLRKISLLPVLFSIGYGQRDTKKLVQELLV